MMLKLLAVLSYLTQAYHYFPHRSKADPKLAAHIPTLMKADEEKDEIPHGPGRFKFKNDTFVSDYVSLHHDESTQVYFLLAESRSHPKTAPLVIWFQGGPGCSSMLGLWTENGPYNYVYNSSSTSARAMFEYNKHSWNNEAHVLYID
jgi:hypothetical protein